MSRFVVIGQRATASGDFALDDLPSSSGRMDILLRCVRAALLSSHGIRRDVSVYLVLCGGAGAQRTIRIQGATARFIRPDERSLAMLAKKVLALGAQPVSRGFVETRFGAAVADRGIDSVLADVAGNAVFVLEQGAPDIRDCAGIDEPGSVFFLGDHLGLSEVVRAQLSELGARAVSVGPTSLHSEDVIAIALNEIERRRAQRGTLHRCDNDDVSSMHDESVKDVVS